MTLAEASAHVRQDGTTDDALLTALIVSARQHCENDTRRAFVTQTWKLTLDGFPDSGIIRLPRPNLLSVTGITYVDDNGVEQTLAASQYTVITDTLPGEIHEAYDVDWPTTRAVPDAVRITYTAGYGATAASVPGPIKSAMLLAIGHWYANRESVITGTISTELPMAVDSLLGPYRYIEAI